MDPLRRNLTNDKANKLLTLVNMLRDLDDEIPAQCIATLFYVASHNNCHKQALEEDLGFTTASGSRNTDRLSKHHRLNKPGMDLIKKEPDPFNKRRLQLKLTPKGQVFMDQLLSVIYD